MDEMLYTDMSFMNYNVDYKMCFFKGILFTKNMLITMCYSSLHKRVSQGKRLSYHSVSYLLLPSLPNYPSAYPPKFAIMLNLALQT